MSYRDDREALRQRVDELEQEVAALRRARERAVEGEQPGPVNVFLGAPTKLAWERSFEGELDEESQAELIAVLRREIGDSGRLESFGGTTTWTSGNRNSTRFVELEIEARRGKTRLRLRESYGNLAGAMFGGIVGGAGGGGLGIVGPVAGALVSGIAAAPASVGWLGMVYVATRSGFRQTVEKRRVELRAVFSDVSQRAADELDHQRAQQRVAVRVDTGADAAAELEVEAVRDERRVAAADD